MKLNNKGFTLIELLAVVVLLLAISVIAISSISASIERSKVKQNKAKIDVIVSYGRLYFDEHKNSTYDGFCVDITYLNLTEEEMTTANGSIFEGCVKKNGNDYCFIKKVGDNQCLLDGKYE